MSKFLTDDNLMVNVITSKKSIDRVDPVLNTWGKHIKNLEFFSDYSDPAKKVFEVSTVNNCSVRGYYKLQRILNDPIKYKWHFFVDDDTFVNAYAVSRVINELDENIAYGFPCDCFRYPNLKYLQGGAGMLISGNIIEKFRGIKYDGTSCVLKCEEVGHESGRTPWCNGGVGEVMEDYDAYFGYLLRDLNISIDYKYSNFLNPTPEFYRPSLKNDTMTIHKISNEQMFQLYSEFYTQ